MAFFYSAATGGFYHDAIHDEAARPADAVPVSDEDHAALFSALSQGKVIAPGPDGRPVAVDEPEPTAEVAMQTLRRQRDRLLSDSDRTQIPDYPITEAARAAWAAYRQQLRDLPEALTDPATAVWPTPPAEEGAHA